MSTNGAIGFRKDNKDKITYNHCDSYPSWLGVQVFEFVQSITADELAQIADKIQLITEDDKPTQEQIEECEKYMDLRVDDKSPDNWYCLLRKAQGNLAAYKDILYMIDSHDFLRDSLFCEWAYVINVDENIVEIYKGLNKELGGKGRYANRKEPDFKRDGVPVIKSEYYGVTLIKTISFDDVKDIKDIKKYMSEIEAGKKYKNSS